MVGAHTKSAVGDVVSLRCLSDNLGGDGDVKEAVGSESGAGMRHRWDTYLDITCVWM